MSNKKEASPVSFSRRVGKILLIYAFGLAMALVLLEVGLRIYYARHPSELLKGVPISPKPDYSYELVSPDKHKRISRGQGWIKLVYRPYSFYKNLPKQDTELYHINSLGLRGEEVTPSKGEGVYRIIITGNSATFGVGASSDHSTLPYLLQQKLNGQGKFPQRVEVLNAGVIGYLTTQELVCLQMELSDLDPDLIIAYNGYNDFISPAYRAMGCTKPLENPQQAGYQGLFYEIERTLLEHVNEKHLSLSARAMAILTSLCTRTYTGRFLQEKLRGTALASKPSPEQVSAADLNSGAKATDGLIPDCVERIVGNYQWNLERISELAIDWGVKSVMVVQPELSWKRQRSPEENRSMEKMTAANPWYERAAAEIYSSFLQAAGRAAGEHGVGFLDLSHVFDSHPETLFLDLVHLNDSGNEIVAQALADYLLNGGQDAQP